MWLHLMQPETHVLKVKVKFGVQLNLDRDGATGRAQSTRRQAVLNLFERVMADLKKHHIAGPRNKIYMTQKETVMHPWHMRKGNCKTRMRSLTLTAALSCHMTSNLHAPCTAFLLAEEKGLPCPLSQP